MTPLVGINILNGLLHKCGFVPKQDYDDLISMNRELCTTIGKITNEFDMLKNSYEKTIVEGTEQLKYCTIQMDNARYYIQKLECALFATRIGINKCLQ